ncbi:MerR family transcriptional regulator [Ruminococcaceae bacterium OttesenSCG-928-A16]|nr:MerR family transcriptional regulator [Ruminococcaceae bacterium OttesenSCG-928-A16]
MKNTFLIGEVSKLVGISTETLRFYEKEGLIIPQKSEANGYRYYTMQDINQLIDLVFFRDISLSIKEIKEIVKTRGNQDMRQFFTEKQRDVEKSIHNQTLLLYKLRAIEEAHQTIEAGLGVCSILPHPSFYVLSEYDESAESLFIQKDGQSIAASHLYHLCSIGGAIEKDAAGNWDIEKQYLYILRRAAMDYGVTEKFKDKTLVNSKRSAHTVVALSTPEALLQGVTNLLAWMDENGYSQTDLIRFNYLLTNVFGRHTQSYAELWIPVV